MPWNSVHNTPAPSYATEAGSTTMKIESDVVMRPDDETVDEGIDEVLMETSNVYIENSVGDEGEDSPSTSNANPSVIETPKSSRTRDHQQRKQSTSSNTKSHSAKKSPRKPINSNDGRRWTNKAKLKAGKSNDQLSILNFVRPRQTPNTLASTSKTPNPQPPAIETTTTMPRPSTSVPTASSSSTSNSNNSSNSNGNKVAQKRKGTPATPGTRAAKTSKSTVRKKKYNSNNNNKARRRHSFSSENESDSQMEISSGSEYQTDDSDEEGATRDSIPTMSIHRIIVEKLVEDPENFRPNRRHRNEASTVEEQAMINIMKHHKELQQENKRLKQEPFVQYEEKPITISHSKKNTYFKDTPVQDFKARLYVQVTEHRDTLLSFYESRGSRRSVHKVWFFYRAGDLFALTTGQAWSVVHEYADFTFHMKIANRLGSEDGPKTMEGKVLAGNTVNTKTTNKDAHAKTPNDMPLLPSRYKFELRPNSSIFMFKCFEAESTGSVKTFIECGVSHIRFSKPFEISDYPLILHHLSIIHHEKPTYKYFSKDDTNDTRENDDRPVQDQTTVLINNNNDTNNIDENLNPSSPLECPPTPRAGSASPSITPSSSQESLFDSQASTVNVNSENRIPERDTDVYRTYFTKVPKETQIELQTKLAELFQKTVNLNRRNEPSELLRSFNLSHKYIGDFSTASSFILRNKGVKINNNNNNTGQNNHSGYPRLPSNPTLTDVVNIISRNKNDYFRNLHNYDNSNGYENYKAEMKKVYIDYTTSTKSVAKDKTHSGNLLSFIDGVILHKCNNSLSEEKYYWKINNCWYTTDQTYICNVHSWAAQFFKTNLIPKENNLLRLKWLKSTRNTSGNYERQRNLKEEYIQAYIQENPKCFFSGTNAKQKTSLFDLLHIDEDTKQMSIYFISTDFECQTRNICRRIFLCYHEIFKYIKPKRRTGFFKLYKEHTLNPVKKLQAQEFARMLSKVRLIYALVNTEPMRVTTGEMDNYIRRENNDSDNQRTTTRNKKISLIEESKIPTEVTVDEIQKILNQLQDDSDPDRLTESDISTILSNQRVQQQKDSNITGDRNRQFAEWINEKLTYRNPSTDKQYVAGNRVTTDLLYCTAETFEIHDLNYPRGTAEEEQLFLKIQKIKDKIFHDVVSKFKTKYTSMPAKLELRELAKEVDKNQDISFSICEIEEEEQVPARGGREEAEIEEEEEVPEGEENAET